MIEAYFDGFCEGNPYGKAGAGAVIQKDGEIIHTISDYIGEGVGITNNVAEYEALRRALNYLKASGLNDERVIVYGDSKLVIEQMRGKWKIKKGIYKDSALEARKEIESFKNITFCWIPKEKNTQADELSQKKVFK